MHQPMRTRGGPPGAAGTAGALPRASTRDAAGLAGDVLLPVVAGGVIVRRPLAMSVVERTAWDRRGIDRVRALHSRYGPGPLLVTRRGRTTALVLDPGDVHRVLAGTPDPFSPATREKRAALAQFQPHGVLISSGALREHRRHLAEDVLETSRPLHRLAGRLSGTVREEAALLLRDSARTGQLAWEDFHAAWWRVVRRIVLGDAAREDRTLTAQLGRLRSAANWSFLSPRHRRYRESFLERVRTYADLAEPGSLASLVARERAAPRTDPAGQIPHWLFAYDAAAMATLRALALLATHPAHEAQARRETAGGDSADQAYGSGQGGDGEAGRAAELPFLRACAQESLRLWPTTPLILRQSVAETTWRDGATLPAGTALVLYTPYLHRAEPAGPYGDTFAPWLWTEGPGGEGHRNPALVPFSSGPAGCPGENLVLFTVSTFLAALLEGHTYALASHPELHPALPLPATLDHFALRFRVHPA